MGLFMRPRRPIMRLAAVAAAPAQDPLTQEIEELATLHTGGVLFDAEFTAAKAKPLGI